MTKTDALTMKQFRQRIAALDDALDMTYMAEEVILLAWNAVQAEREACAKHAENWGHAPPNPRGRRAQLAAELRAGEHWAERL